MHGTIGSLLTSNTALTAARISAPAVEQVPEAARVLIAARKLIEKPENWRQGGYGFSMAPMPHCALGAMIVASRRESILLAGPARVAEDIMREVVGGCIMRFNDTHTHAEVLRAFDKAIELALQDAVQ